MLTMCYLLFVIGVLIAQKHWSKSPGLEGLCSLKAVAFSLLFSVYCEAWYGSGVLVWKWCLLLLPDWLPVV